eukprot:CAMPEP_0119277528 /NCGR_PEP_ID=MMETSP1329-20130426/17316_1 /TAXON_ID=114041 /ORGANISM="Genus nov. species nov., Strain RCC1024" /LENGTH=30 /DNA_ID= /DNA_START= /DNA_END= /DNA_ORIENTATION=
MYQNGRDAAEIGNFEIVQAGADARKAAMAA